MLDDATTEFTALCAEAAQAVAEGGISVADAADRLQDRALYTALIEAIGQDEVQRLMSDAFAPTPDLPSDYVYQLVRGWELADDRDRWRRTGELPPAPQPTPEWPPRRPHSTPQSVIDAFFLVLGTGDADRLSSWLAAHPRDVSNLHELWRAKCATAA